MEKVRLSLSLRPRTAKSIQQLTQAKDLASAQSAIAELDEQVALFRRTFK